MVQRGVKLSVDHIRQRTIPIAGRLAHFLSNWVVVSKDYWVLDTVQGYRLEFLKKPIQPHHPPKGEYFLFLEQNIILREIESMLQKGAITELSQSEVAKGSS